MTTTQKYIPAVVLGVATFAIASFAFALHSPEHYSFFGDASYVSPGNASSRAVHIVSDASPGFGGINFPVEAGMTFAQLTTLSSDFQLEADDTCIGGSPRAQIKVQTPTSGVKNIFAYFGIDSAGVPCVSGTWQNTGDFLETGRLLDTSQLGGTFYDPYTNALANYGSYPVVSIQIVTDSSWIAADGEHAADIDNTLINSTLFTYEIPVATDKDQCKNGGWKNLVDSEGNPFKNQGQCVASTVPADKGNGGGPGPN
ncbi:MAG: hypothetical protein AAB908_00925 [Patescibacteria group bacterium]